MATIKDSRQFRKLQKNLEVFPNIPVSDYHYVKSAQLYKEYISKGIQASHIDFIITSVAIEEDFELYTYNKDIENIAEIISLKLLQL